MAGHGLLQRRHRFRKGGIALNSQKEYRKSCQWPWTTRVQAPQGARRTHIAQNGFPVLPREAKGRQPEPTGHRGL